MSYVKDGVMLGMSFLHTGTCQVQGCFHLYKDLCLKPEDLIYFFDQFHLKIGEDVSEETVAKLITVDDLIQCIENLKPETPPSYNPDKLVIPFFL